MMEELSTVHPAILFSAAVGVVAICQFVVSLLLSLSKSFGGKGNAQTASPVPKLATTKLARTASAGTRQKRTELSMWQRHQALISKDDPSPQQPIDDEHGHGRPETLDARQKRIRQIMTGRAESPEPRYPRPETTIQEESLSRTSSTEVGDSPFAQSPSHPVQQRLTRPSRQRKPSLPAFIKRTGSGVRSDEGAVDTPISSPLVSPRRSRNMDMGMMGGLGSPLPAPVIPFGRTGSSSSNFLPRSSSSVAFEAMMEDDDLLVQAPPYMAREHTRGDDQTADPPMSPMSPIARTGSGSGLQRTASVGIAPYRAGATPELDILEELRGVLDVSLPGKSPGNDLRMKDDLRHDPPEEVEERRGRSQRPKTLYWQKKTYAPGNWITRGTESPTRDLSPMRGGYELQERSVSPVRPPRGW
eukprot:Tamp_14125.p1 GENE.Tamp_14125~~Tamp_14125.p1  ORF type:complete len:425 (-),score=23.29 Tamp_14125:381-1625(-)